MRWICLVPILVLFFSSCSFAPEPQPTERSAEFPDMHLEKAQYVLKTTDEHPILLEAAVIEMWESTNQAFLTDVTFFQRDSDGTLLLSGFAGEAVIDRETNNMIMRNNVEVTNHQEQLKISAEELAWNNEKQVLKSDGDTIVTLIKGEHDILVGRGFCGEFSTATYEFASIEEGHLHYE